LSQIYDLQNIEAANSGTFWSLALTDAIKARNKQAAIYYGEAVHFLSLFKL